MSNALTKARLSGLVRDTPIFHQHAPATASVTATLTTTQLLAGILNVDQASGATTTLTTPTATELDSALSGRMIANEAFDLFIINTETDAGGNCVLAMGTGMTLVGNNDIEEEDAVANSSSAHFRFRKTADAAYTCYRIA